MDEAKVLVAKRTKKRLALYRVVLSCPWVILWTFVFTHQYSLNIDLRFINLLLYPGIIFFLFATDWTSRKIYSHQVKAAYYSILKAIPSFDSDSSNSVLLLHDVLSSLCRKSLFLDKCGNDPYQDTWISLYRSVSKRVSDIAFSSKPDNLPRDGEELLNFFIGLGKYGLSYDYISAEGWNKKIDDLASSLDVFENAHQILKPETTTLSDWKKKKFDRTRVLLWKDIHVQLIAAWSLLERQHPSSVWEDISASPYPFFNWEPSYIKRDFCSDKSLTVEKYIFDECLLWCNWHIKNYPTAYVQTDPYNTRPYTMVSSLSALEDFRYFLQKESKDSRT